MKYFDYESVAREAKISPAKLRHLLNLLREEFPNDPLMYVNSTCCARVWPFVTVISASTMSWVARFRVGPRQLLDLTTQGVIRIV